ncbi:MAG: hypothetical protein ACI4AQ_04160 [Lachnospiraceae bacterium]
MELDREWMSWTGSILEELEEGTLRSRHSENSVAKAADICGRWFCG